MTSETVLKGVNTLPLFASFAGVGILLFAFGAMWWREGRSSHAGIRAHRLALTVGTRGNHRCALG
ncbi:hypothetical protein ACC860_37055, partial [Rhizobium ruizarguesonis]